MFSSACDKPPSLLQPNQPQFPVRPFPVERGDVIRFAMKAQRAEVGDQRLPVYFIDGDVLRDDRVVHRFFYRHHGSFE